MHLLHSNRGNTADGGERHNANVLELLTVLCHLLTDIDDIGIDDIEDTN